MDYLLEKILSNGVHWTVIVACGFSIYEPFEYKLFFTLVVQVHMKLKNNADE